MARMNHEEPTTVEVLNQPFHCYACRYDRFWQRSALLNTSLATLFTFDWLDPSATCCICARCGHIHWFQPPQADVSSAQATPERINP
jgi:hypothetical protein